MSNYVCIFDCESVPDVQLIRQSDFGNQNKKMSDEELCFAFLEHYNKENNTTFLPLPYHKIIAICAVLATEFGDFIKVDKLPGENEEELINNFFAMINKSKPKLVSFNGKGYDCPLLVLRAMKYELDASAYLDTRDKWNNYKTRFNEGRHCDLLESLTAFGQRGMRLDLICKMLDFPGKYDVSGDDVARLYWAGELAKIEEYCESDVLNTYLLFINYELIKRNINPNDYIRYLENMHAYLSEYRYDAGYHEPFVSALEKRILKGVKL